MSQGHEDLQSGRDDKHAIRRRAAVVVLLVGCVAQSGCYFRPSLVRYQDPDCQVVSYKLTPQLEQRRAVLADEPNCAGEECRSTATVSAVSSVILLPVSAVLTGVTVLVGNSVLWVDKQFVCRRPPRGQAEAGERPERAD